MEGVYFLSGTHVTYYHMYSKGKIYLITAHQQSLNHSGTEGVICTRICSLCLYGRVHVCGCLCDVSPPLPPSLPNITHLNTNYSQVQNVYPIQSYASPKNIKKDVNGIC